MTLTYQVAEDGSKQSRNV